MSAESANNPSSTEHGSGPTAEHAPASGATLHRICIQCNNVFCVTPDHYDAKHCPVCRKD